LKSDAIVYWFSDSIPKQFWLDNFMQLHYFMGYAIEFFL
jgi:hypothetical protein